MPQNNCKTIFISTAEPSGDLYASKIIQELKKSLPDAIFCGIGGERMQEAGAKLLYSATCRGAVGLIEGLIQAPALYFAYKKAVKYFNKHRPDLVLFIDSQGLNIPLAKEAKKRGIKTVYYIAPQDWLWGTTRGVKNVISYIDLILTIFNESTKSYKENGGNVVYCGHPLLDIVDSSLDKNTCRERLNIPKNSKVVGILP
ncbi:MAG: lipid-A-disaccharide synthase, partial [bacterium]